MTKVTSENRARIIRLSDPTFCRKSSDIRERNFTCVVGTMLQSRELSLIYVVDDEEIIASTVTAILRLHGLDALAFTRSIAVLQRSIISPPDLLIADVMMPQMSGPELALNVQWSHPKCRVLLFTGQLDQADEVIAAFEDGLVYQLIPKPVHPRQLVNKVCEMLDLPIIEWQNAIECADTRSVEGRKKNVAGAPGEIADSTGRNRTSQQQNSHHSQK